MTSLANGTVNGTAAPATTTWKGNQLTQDELMAYDTVLVLDTNDKVIGSASKKDSHVFNKQQPHGILHRAFSVFLFDISTNKLLLHKRASDKITFPNVRYLKKFVCNGVSIVFHVAF